MRTDGTARPVEGSKRREEASTDADAAGARRLSVAIHGAIRPDLLIYKLCNRIERCFNRLKLFRRIATRFARLASHYLALVHIAAFMLWTR